MTLRLIATLALAAASVFAQAPQPAPPKPRVISKPKPKPTPKATPAPAAAPAPAPTPTPRKRTPVAKPPAVSTFMPQVKAALGKGWLAALEPRAAEFVPGETSVLFKIDATGKVADCRVTANSSNEAFAAFCEQFVRDTAFDPPPARILTEGALEVPFTFTLY